MVWSGNILKESLWLWSHLCSQEDDIDGEHIVAFAEEDDPGKFFIQHLYDLDYLNHKFKYQANTFLTIP